MNTPERRAIAVLVLLLLSPFALAMAQEAQTPAPTPPPTPAPTPAPTPVPAATPAQDDEEPAEKSVRIYVEIGTWGAEPLGLEYEPATRETGTVAGTEIVTMDHEPQYEGYYEAGLVLGRDFGHVRASWYAQTENSDIAASDPGSFRYGQILSHPYLAGFANDGLADGFTAASTTRYSEFRLDLMRPAFRSESILGTWFVGVRRITHDRELAASYFALSPTLPPILPPNPALIPNADQALVTSRYQGRGIEVGMEFRMPIVPDRFEFETGFAVAALRGKIDATYESTNWAYVFNDDGDADTPPVVLTPPYGDEFGDAATSQGATTTRLVANGRSTVSPAVDMFVGVRGRVWRGLELLLGFRDAYYGDVGVDLRPKVVTSAPGGVNVQDVTEVDRSVQYEGGYFSVAFTF